MLKPLPTLVCFLPSGGPVSVEVANAWLQQLHLCGLNVCSVHTTEQLQRHLQVADYHACSPLALLAADTPQNVLLCAYLRGVLPLTGVACAVNLCCEDDIKAVLDAGADLYLSHTASGALVRSAIGRLAGRLVGAPDLPGGVLGMGVTANANVSVWAMAENASVAVSPSGVRIPLATIEGKVFQLLMAAPGMSLTHGRLLSALRDAGVLRGDPSTARTRLSVVLSRLRRKFEGHGESLPVVSVHGWGYKFTGRVGVAAALQSDAASCASCVA